MDLNKIEALIKDGKVTDPEWWLKEYSFSEEELKALLGECFVEGRVHFNITKDKLIDNLFKTN